MNERPETTPHGTRLTSIEDLETHAGEIHKRLARFAAVRLKVSDADAEDLAQEAYMKAWADRDQYVDSGSLMSWLIIIMKNLQFDKLRGQRKRAPLQDRATEVIEHQIQSNEHHQTPDVLIERVRRSEIARNAIRSLPGLQGEIFEMYVNGESQEDIGAIFGKSIDAVQSTILRAKKALRQNDALKELLATEGEDE
jgi:RNA polymerase sigma-70 factor, ECF subfamily